MLQLLCQSEAPGRFETIVDSLARTPLSKVVLFVAACTVIRVALHPFLLRVAPHQRGYGWAALRFVNETLDALVYAGVVVFLVIRPFGIQAFRIPSGSMLDTLQINDFIVANKIVYRYSSPQPGDIVVFRPPVRACTRDQIDADGQPKVDFIKRCIGVPGDLIEIRAGTLYRNGKPVNEPYRRNRNAFDWKLVKYQGAYQPWNGQYVPVITDSDGQPNYAVDAISKVYAIGWTSHSFDQGNEPWANGWKSYEELTDEEKARIQELADAPPARIPPRHYLMMGDNREGSFDGRAWGLVPEEDIIGRSEFVWFPFSRWRSTR